MPKKRPVTFGTQNELNAEISQVIFHASVVANTLQSYLHQDDPTRQKWNLLTHQIEALRKEILIDFAARWKKAERDEREQAMRPN